MSDHYEVGDKCPYKNCNGIFNVQDSDSCCSCHIVAPCSYCENMTVECSECGFEYRCCDETPIPQSAYHQPVNSTPIQKKITIEDLDKNKFNYISLFGGYYNMTYKGFYPKGWDSEKLLSQFNTCFGYRDFTMKDGYFEITVYTD